MSSILLHQVMPVTQMPLALRSEAHGTSRQAAGYGAQLAQARVIENIAAELHAKVANAGTMPDLRSGPHPAGPEHVLLRQPDMARLDIAAGAEHARLSPEAKVSLVVGLLLQAIGKGSLGDLNQRLHATLAKAQAMAAMNQHLSEAFENALATAEAAGAEVEAASAEAGAAEGALEAAKAEVAQLRAELDALHPADPEYAAKQNALAAATQRLQAAQGRLDTATAALLAAGNTLSDALDALDQHREKMLAAGAQQAGMPPMDRRELSAAATLQKLLTMLSALAAEVSLDRLKNETESLMAALEARTAQNRETLRKQEEEAQRARDAEKKTGCFGKIFKWVAAAASVVVLAVGVVTANPALIAAGVISVAMTIDGIVGEHTGFSVMGKLTEVIGAGISKALQAFGVSSDLADQIGSIAAAVVMVAIVIAASIAAGNLAGALHGASAAVAASRMSQVVEAAVQVTQVLGQLAGLAASITHGVGQIIVAGIMIDVARLMKTLETGLFADQMLRELIDKVRDAVVRLDKVSYDLLVQASSVMRDSDNTGRSIINAMRA